MLIALVTLLAVPATAGAVADLRIVDHVVPTTVSTGDVVQVRVTVTNVGDTSTEADTKVEWAATNNEGSIDPDFVMRPPVCPPGSEGVGLGPCLISTMIAPGASITALFSGSSRRAAILEARASVMDRGTGLSHNDTKPLTITGVPLLDPPGPRITRLRLEDSLLNPGEQARLQFTLDRPAKTLHTSLFRCLGRTGCRRTQIVGFSTITRRGRRGPNALAYPLPAQLARGRYRISVWAYEPFRRTFYRSVTLLVVPRRG